MESKRKRGSTPDSPTTAKRFTPDPNAFDNAYVPMSEVPMSDELMSDVPFDALNHSKASKWKRSPITDMSTTSKRFAPNPNALHNPDVPMSEVPMSDVPMSVDSQATMTTPAATSATLCTGSSTTTEEHLPTDGSAATATSRGQGSGSLTHSAATATGSNTRASLPIVGAFDHTPANLSFRLRNLTVLKALEDMCSAVNHAVPADPDTDHWCKLLVALNDRVSLLSKLDPSLTTFISYSDEQPTRSRLAHSMSHNPETATMEESFAAMHEYVVQMGEGKVADDMGYDLVRPIEWYGERLEVVREWLAWLENEAAPLVTACAEVPKPWSWWDFSLLNISDMEMRLKEAEKRYAGAVRAAGAGQRAAEASLRAVER